VYFNHFNITHDCFPQQNGSFIKRIRSVVQNKIQFLLQSKWFSPSNNSFSLYWHFVSLLSLLSELKKLELWLDVIWRKARMIRKPKSPNQLRLQRIREPRRRPYSRPTRPYAQDSFLIFFPELIGNKKKDSFKKTLLILNTYQHRHRILLCHAFFTPSIW